jgi:hypothetical protein
MQEVSIAQQGIARRLGCTWETSGTAGAVLLPKPQANHGYCAFLVCCKGSRTASKRCLVLLPAKPLCPPPTLSPSGRASVKRCRYREGSTGLDRAGELVRRSSSTSCRYTPPSTKTFTCGAAQQAQRELEEGWMQRERSVSTVSGPRSNEHAVEVHRSSATLGEWPRAACLAAGAAAALH